MSMILTTDRNLKAIGPGIDVTGRAGEELTAGELVYKDTDNSDRYYKCGADHQGTVGIVLNIHPPEETFEEDEMIKVRQLNVAIGIASEEISEGEFVKSAADGKVEPADAEADFTNGYAIGKAKTGAGEDTDPVVINLI